MKTLGLDTSWRPLTTARDLCKRLKAEIVTLHTILLGVGGSIYTSNTLHHLKEPGLDSQRAHKTALNFMLTLCIMRRRALEKANCSQGLGLEQGAASHPPNPH
jgi:hypothetical protein